MSLPFGSSSFGLDASLDNGGFLVTGGANGSSLFDTEFASLIGTDDFMFGDEVKMSAGEMMAGSLFEDYSRRSGVVADSNNNNNNDNDNDIHVKVEDKSIISSSPIVSFLDTVNLNMNTNQDMDFKLFDTITTPHVRGADIDDDETKDMMMGHCAESADFEGMFESSVLAA